MKLSILAFVLLLTASLCQAFELYPASLNASLSIRNAREAGNPTDYEVAGGASWRHTKSEILHERENGSYYIGYRLEQIRPIYGQWTVTAKTQIIQAQGINRQVISVGRKWSLVGVGAGMATVDYTADKSRGIMSFWIPLPQGEITNMIGFLLSPITKNKMNAGLTYATDFNNLHLWEGMTRMDFPVGERVTPFIKGEILFDDTKRYWKLKGGVEINL